MRISLRAHFADKARLESWIFRNVLRACEPIGFLIYVYDLWELIQFCFYSLCKQNEWEVVQHAANKP